jgi:hypothetical protein
MYMDYIALFYSFRARKILIFACYNYTKLSIDTGGLCTMYRAKADAHRQRMDIVINQALSADEFDQLISEIRNEASQLDTGWVAAVDLRGMWVSDPFINQQFESLQNALLESQAGKIGTILESDPIKMHLWQAGIRTSSNAITQRFYTLKEWEEFLNQP